MSTEPGERKQQNETGGTTDPRRPIWRRAGVWVGGVAAAALATVLAGAMSQGFGWFEVAVNTQGDPVDVRVDAEPRMDDVVLSPSAELSTTELADLADRSAEDQVGWLVKNEHGEVSGPRRVTLYLTGNRAGTVRITDLTSVETCEPISRGTLVRMRSGRGAGVESEIVNLHVGEGPSEAYVYDEVGNPQDYFPERTITLARDEQMALVVDFDPAFTGSICQVQLDMTVWDGNTKHIERVSGPDGPFVVMSIELYEDESEYDAVYLGGEVCHQYVAAPPDWSMNGEACGEGNRAEW